MAGNINKAYSWAINTCEAPNVGYWSQNPQRNQQTINNITYYDCSSFINYALVNGGFSTPDYAPNHNAFTTYTMGAVLIGLGFTQLRTNSSFEWKAGDIGVSTEHTEMCYEDGTGTAIFMGAHTNKYPLADQVSIGKNAPTSFPYCYRWKDGGAEYSGYSEYVVAALAGNSWGESTVNPDVGWNGDIAYGMFQWDVAAGRGTKLKNYLIENSYALYDGDAQLQFLIDENIWISASWTGTDGYVSGTSKYNTLAEFLDSDSTNVSDLVKEFMFHWERPADSSSLQKRIDFAQKALEFIQKHSNDTSIKEWIYRPSPNYFLTEEEALNNAVMMYRFLSSGSGGHGGTTPGSKKKPGMPVWMMIKYRVMR